MLEQSIIAYVNPASGDGIGKKIKKELAKKNISVIDRLKIEALHSSKAAYLLICGGDGTVHHVVNYLVKHQLLNKFILMIHPIGTGNDLARSLGFTKIEVLEELDNLIKKESLSFPLWQLTRRTSKAVQHYFFINYASFGMDAVVQEEVNHWRKLLPKKRISTFIAYIIAFFKNVFQTLPKDLEIFTNGKRINPPKFFSNIIISNINSYAGGSKIGLKKKASDAKLNFLIIRNFLHYLKLILTRFLFFTAPPFSLIKELRLKGKDIRLQIDGEVLPYHEGYVEIKVSIAAYLRFIKLSNH